MSSKYTFSVLLLATLVGCSANTTDKEKHPDNRDTVAAKLPDPSLPPSNPPTPIPSTGADSGKPVIPEVVLMPMAPEPEHPATNWPEFDKMIGVMETAVRNTYGRKGEIDEGEVRGVEEAMRALAASTKGNDSRKLAGDAMTRTLEDMKMLKGRMPSGDQVPPGVKIDRIRMPISRTRDAIGAFDPSIAQPQVRRIEWMLVTLDEVQRYADLTFGQRGQKP